MTVTSTGETGACTLRGAIEAVNTNNSGTACGPVLSGGPTPINLAANTYTLTAGQLQVAAGANLEIIGATLNAPAQTVIDAGGRSRVFEIAAGAQVKLSAVKVTGGQSPSGAAAGPGLYGGFGLDGGGILNRGALTLDRVLVTGNLTGGGGRGGDGNPASNGSARYGKGGGPSGFGGGIYNDTNAVLIVDASTISGNGTGDGGNGGNGVGGTGGQVGAFIDGSDGGMGGYPGSGGGIYNAGTATITDTTISGNFTGRGGNGGAGGQGAAGANNFPAGKGGWGGDGGSASFVRYEYDGSYRLHNSMGGGGIANHGTLTVTDSTISANHTGAGGNGGGAGNAGQGEDGQYRGVSNAGYGGSGGLGGGLLTINGRVDLTNVTISGNWTGDGGNGGSGSQSGSSNTGPGGYGGYGGGIWASGYRSPYYLALTHVTVAKNFPGAAGSPGPVGTVNSSVGAPGVRGQGAGLAVGPRYDPGGASVRLKNTIIADNGLPSDSNCVDSGASPSNYSDQGGNLTWGGTTCPGISADPKLGPLQNNGGPTLTMLPQTGSAAIDAIASGCSDVPADQRGWPRPSSDNPACDAGAVEVGPAPPITPTTATVSPSDNPVAVGQPVTLKATVSPPPGAGTVTFTDDGIPIPGCSGKSLDGSGQATCAANFSSAGTHSIVVSYTGTSAYGPSTSPTLSQVVTSAPLPNRTLSVRTLGGPGTVASSPAGISCGSQCSAAFSQGATVTLTATPGPGATFAGWGGACSGTGMCQVTLGGDNVEVTASFATLSGPIRGNAGNNTLTGTKAADKICGLGGKDVLSGLGGKDTLYGDACGDSKRLLRRAAADGNDKLRGGAGDDALYGAGGKDLLDGGSGKDRLNGGAGQNTYAGGSGADVISARNRAKDRIDCGPGKDTAIVDKVDVVKRCETVKRGR